MSHYENVYTSDQYVQGDERDSYTKRISNLNRVKRFDSGTSYFNTGYDEIQKREQKKMDIQKYDFVNEELRKIFMTDRALHLYSHFGINRITLNLGSCGFYRDLKSIPYKSNITCSMCTNITPEQDKYVMVYEFLKKKIGPDCARLVVYQTVGMDHDTSKNNEQSNIKYRISNYFSYNEEYLKLKELYKSYDVPFYVHGHVDTPTTNCYIDIY